jgi:hypothetical protein
MNDDRMMKLVTPFGYRHPQLVARVRVAVGVWLLIVTAIMYGYGVGGWWGMLLLPAAALLFYLAYREPQAIRARAASREES